MRLVNGLCKLQCVHNRCRKLPYRIACIDLHDTALYVIDCGRVVDPAKRAS